MIKTIKAQDALQMVREGKEVYYFDLESKEIAPLSKVFESVPGAFLVEDGTPIKETEAHTHIGAGAEAPHKVSECTPASNAAKKPKGRPVKKNIDTGKVMALRRAGWPITKIADEMGVSVATICYHVKKLESEVQDV